MKKEIFAIATLIIVLIFTFYARLAGKIEMKPFEPPTAYYMVDRK